MPRKLPYIGSMTQDTWHLPNPETQAEFYQDVAGKRLVAFVIDLVITMALSLLAVLMTAFVGLLVFPALWLTITFVYRALTISAKSATIGMRIMAIELRDHQGRTLDPMLATLHTLGFVVSTAAIIPQLISIALMATSTRAQGLTDHVLGTVMINRRAGS